MHTVFEPCNCDWSPVNGCHRQTVELETYPPMFSDYDNYIENYNYDNELRLFSVPKVWFINFIENRFEMTEDEFWNEYTWDDTYLIYDNASSEKVIISDRIVDR